MLSCQKGPAHHAYAWQIGPFWQDALNIKASGNPQREMEKIILSEIRQQTTTLWEYSQYKDIELCAYILIYTLTLNVQGPSYLSLTRSIPWLLIP